MVQRKRWLRLQRLEARHLRAGDIDQILSFEDLGSTGATGPFAVAGANDLPLGGNASQVQGGDPNVDASAGNGVAPQVVTGFQPPGPGTITGGVQSGQPSVVYTGPVGPGTITGGVESGQPSVVYTGPVGPGTITGGIQSGQPSVIYTGPLGPGTIEAGYGSQIPSSTGVDGGGSGYYLRYSLPIGSRR